MTTVNNKPSSVNVRNGALGGSLIALVGSAVAIILFTETPKEESGRTVKVTETPSGGVTIKHVKGRQYLTAYRDIVGVVTICDGDTHNVRAGQVATEQECSERLERQLVAHASKVLKCVPQLSNPARANQLTSSVLLAYNIGWPRFCRSTSAKRFRAGNWRGGCWAARWWNKAGGRKVRGLVNRRAREYKICMKGL